LIVTVTLNPAIDKTAEVERLEPGRLNRLRNVRLDAGGKGVNVSKMIRALGGESVCVGLVAGPTGEELLAMIKALGLNGRFLPASGGLTRVNLKVVDQDGTLTELNEPGVEASPKDLDALLDLAVSLAGPGGLCALSGSLPKGADPGVYGRYAEKMAASGIKVLLDAEGEALRLGLAARPHLVKPNRFELTRYFGVPEDLPEAELPPLCRELVKGGAAMVILSLGADGAMFFTADSEARARALPVKVRSSVGAGDSMVGAAALAIERDLSFESAARLAMAASIGAVATEGTTAPAFDVVESLVDEIVLEAI
jgi:1-phosphofructokinase